MIADTMCYFIGGPLAGRSIAVPAALDRYCAYKPLPQMLGAWNAAPVESTREEVRYDRTGPAQFTLHCEDHDWHFVDESFDHDLGTEVIHSQECQKCGATRPAEPMDPGDV
jgi:hypothetical protein